MKEQLQIIRMAFLRKQWRRKWVCRSNAKNVSKCTENSTSGYKQCKSLSCQHLQHFGREQTVRVGDTFQLLSECSSSIARWFWTSPKSALSELSISSSQLNNSIHQFSLRLQVSTMKIRTSMSGIFATWNFSLSLQFARSSTGMRHSSCQLSRPD